MAARRTLDFLPSIFQTDTNRKFLAATLDQLVSEPEFTRLNGYIGRKFAPTYKAADGYVPEVDADRQNYQLEPSLVIKNSSNEVEFYSSYTDLINKISYYGGITADHDRLFSSEYYTYTGLIDLDKFVNYQQYYWLPNGPEPVLIPSQSVTKQATYKISKDIDDRCLRIEGKEGNNPELLLARGGLYKFAVNQPGSKFYIQTEPGVTGTKRLLPSVSTRDVYGVSNNGTDDGVVEFRVPLSNTQDTYLKMPMQAPVDYAVDTPFTEIDGAQWASVVNLHGGFDGSDIDPTNKFVVFLDSSNNDDNWTRASGTVVSEQHRRGVWRVMLTRDQFNNEIVTLSYVRDVANNSRIYSRIGRINANVEFYKNSAGQFLPVPALTAQLDILYYQDASNPAMHGMIRLVDEATDNIYVDTSILGKVNYTSPGGVNFTNGLVVAFDNNVQPTKYANKSFVVEGVGKGIRLVPFDNLVCPESHVQIDTVPWDQEAFSADNWDEPLKGPDTPEYITINRSSLDQNAWARHNRWFHIDVLIKSAEYSNTVATFDQAIRAQRPIIEFEPDIQLINSGRIGKRPVDHIDTVCTDAFNQVQHSKTLTVHGAELAEGDRVLFPNDKDPLVKTQVYKVQYSIQDEPSYASVYDGTGPGTITIAPSKLNYYSGTSPVLTQEVDGLYTYMWTVVGTKDLLTATTITGFDWPNLTPAGVVQEVTDIGATQYQIEFVTNFEIQQIVGSAVSIHGTGGTVTVTGTDTKFTEHLHVGGALFTSTDEYIGTISGIMSDTKVQLASPSKFALIDVSFSYRDPKIQLLISEDPEDALEPYDSLVATKGVNKGNTFWYNGTVWTRSQSKIKANQTPLFDAFDAADTSFSTYKGSKFAGNKILSYKVGSGANDKVLGFPIAYTNVGTVTNTSIADITFTNNFSTETFDYLVGTTFKTLNVDTGYLRQNTGRYSFAKRNVWTTVNEPSRQYQIISNTYTGKTNYFEIDIEPSAVAETPTLKVFLNNTLLDASSYNPSAKFGKRTAVKIPANLLTVGDKVDILLYSKSTSKLAHYQVPSNLNYNSKNEQFSTITLGQLRNNLVAVGQNIPEISGNVPGDSNLRDLDHRAYGGNILQNSASVIYSSLFLINEQANLMSGIDYARREYTKFKNKFVEMCTTLPGLDLDDPKAGVDKILQSINAVKNKSFPWYYSDMVPYGESSTINYSILNTNQRQYKISSIFNNALLQSKAVLVYYNGHQLVVGRDFTFDQTRPAIQLSETLATAIGGTLEIREYISTDGNFIPETPTKLGLYPKFLPAIELDTTYRIPTSVIYGHDGSITPAFGDFRDQYLLELELRIYNNIKVDPSKEILDLRTLVPGRFRTTEYSLAEFKKILNSNFLKWVGSNKLDYISNSYFVSNDPFTYNYRYSKDILFNQALPGYWRGIYQYFYDTDKPHSHPWEMLGFTEEPAWWQDQYGPAPYTSGNTVLWDDIEAGIIRHGTRAGIHTAFARPGLSKIIPVDAAGELRAPLSHIAAQFSSANASESFQVGDMAPVEAAWTRTSEYPYALQAAVALMKPGIYFGTLLDTNTYFKNSDYGQYVDSRTNRRITPNTVAINGEAVGASITRSSGYVNWIVDYLTSLGINGTTKVRALLDNLQVQLSYKVAGFVDKKYLTVLAEQYSPSSTNESVVIPDDSYTVYLNKSVPLERIAYSAVIVEKTETGYTVSGYNISNPYFIVVPSESAGASYNIKVENVSATIYKGFRKQKLVIPYGTEFKTRQQVVDFLVSYQRFLFAQGFIFDEYNPDLSAMQDWVLSAKEFLTWTLQGWKAGSVLILSPVNTTLKLLSTNSVVDQITNNTLGSKVLDPNFGAIRTTDITVMRDQGEFKLQTITGSTVAFADLNLVQYEHVLIFENTTVFSDVIYKPETGSRQYRLKLVGNKTANWDGSLNPAGFVYNSTQVDLWKAGRDYLKGDLVAYKNQYYVAAQKISASTTFNLNYWKQIDKSEIKTGLLPNFANNAGRFVNIYDADSSLLDSQMARMSSSLIGFRDRKYLSDLNINHTSQTKFYQGYIKEKGTKSAVTNLLSANFNDITNDVSYHEEWAVRVGEYGATESNRSVEIVLDESLNRNNPTAISIIADDETAPDGIVGVRDRDLWDRTFAPGAVKFINRVQNAVSESDVQTAGYVNVDDVDATLFDLSQYQLLDGDISSISSGYTVWVAKDQTKDWNVYRASETDTTVTRISYGLDTSGKVTTEFPHGLVAGDTVVIKDFDVRFNGFYRVTSVSDIRSFNITLTNTQVSAIKQDAVTGTGTLFVLDSVRFKHPGDVSGFAPRHGWKDGDIVWVDSNAGNNWAVYEKNGVWNYNTTLDIQFGNYSQDLHYGTSVKIANNDQFVVVGAPGDREGAGRVHVFFKSGPREKGVLSGDITDQARLGHSVDMADTIVVAGAPGSYASNGAAVVYKYRESTFFAPIQLITNPSTLNGSEFGTSVALSDNEQYLYIGAPGSNSVYCYKYTQVDERRTVCSVAEAANGYVMPYQVSDIDSLAVYLHGKLLKLGSDYTWNSNRNTLNFSATVTALLVSEEGIELELENNQTLLSSEYIIGEPGSIVILQRSYYKLAQTCVGPAIDSRFGYSIKCSKDGSQLIVGAPGTTVNGQIHAGKAYVYIKSQAGDTWQIAEELVGTNPVYRAQFGTSVDICKNNCSVYIGVPGYSDLTYRGGIVERFVNAGMLFGSILGSATNPVVTVGHSIIVNGTEVVFSGAGLDSVVADINTAGIAGVRASNQDNQLLITSIVEVEYGKLIVSPGTGTSLKDLGLTVYQVAQVIKKPVSSQSENFGSIVKIGRDAETLAIASTQGSVQTYSLFDSKLTTYDSKTTQFIDVKSGTGSVFFHDFMPNPTTSENKFGNFVFSEQFNAPNLAMGDQFGCGIDFSDSSLYIGASYNDTKQHNAGNVYQYTNPTLGKGWSVKRAQQPAVDVFSINAISLFDIKTKSKLATLDYIDPARGKALGIAESSLSYKSSRDPAMYNSGTMFPNRESIDYHWGKQQVGQTWWDLSTVKFIDYEQDSLVYRVNNWGRMFPGSTVSVYEWVESNVIPSEYVAAGNTGEPLHSNDSSYVELSYADTSSGMIKTKYYFWVRGITSIESDVSRPLSAAAIEDALQDPKSQGIPYAAILSDSSVALFNCDNLISGKNVILKVDYDHVLNSNLIHSEFELIKEGSSDTVMPPRIVNKLVDSLAGADNELRRVPDAKLKPSQRIGLEVRPRQTLVNNRHEALKNVVQFVNKVFATTTASYKLQNSSKFSSAKFFGVDAEPVASEYQHRVADLVEREYVVKVVGERTLVANDENFMGLWTLYEVLTDGTWDLVKNQSFKTPDLWTYTNWYKEGFDPETKPKYIVEYLKDTERLALVPGDIVRVNSSATGGFEVYQYTTKDTAELVAVENGTIKLLDTIWDVEQNNVGFDNNSFEEVGFDRDYSEELRQLITGLEQDMFVDDLVDNYNEFLFVVIRYILSEQQNVDWIFKTSFISVLHKIKELKAYPNFIRDNHDYYEDYINEVKPYRTKIREYTIEYSGIDHAYANTTDFDLPGYFDTELGRFRSPSGEMPTKDGALFLQSEYKDWSKNFTFGVESISISNPGYGYTVPPTVKIVANSDGGSGATAEAVIDNVSGKVVQINVLNSGSGYKSTPHVIINGDGAYARAYANISNRKVRSVKTVMKFDRTSYTTQVREWIAGIQYQAGDMVSYRGQGYRCNVAHSSQSFVSGNFAPIKGSEYTNANDRIAATYVPGPNQVPKEFDEFGNIDLTRIIPGLEYAYNVVSNDPSVYNESSATGTSIPTVNDPSQISISGGSFFDVTKSYAPEELIPGVTADSLSIRVETDDDLAGVKYIYRIDKDSRDVTSYLVVSSAKTTKLVQDLRYDDDRIYVETLDNVTLPNPGLRVPGMIYIGGEKIEFWQIDNALNAIKNPIRGVNGTSTPEVHAAGSVVEDQSYHRVIPETTIEHTDAFVFTARNPVFVPTFAVSNNIELVKNSLQVRNSVTLLTVDVDYTISISNSNNTTKVSIVFARASDFADGIRFTATYVEDKVWLNPGTGTPTDGSGFIASQHPAALFVKQNPHNLS